MEEKKINDERLRRWLKEDGLPLQDNFFEGRLSHKLDTVDGIRSPRLWVRLLPYLFVLGALLVSHRQVWHGVLVVSRLAVEAAGLFSSGGMEVLLWAAGVVLFFACAVLLYPVLKRMV